MEALIAIGHRRADGLRRLPGAARAHLPVVLGLTLLSYAVNLFLFATGRLVIGQPPVIGAGTTLQTRCRRHWCSPPSSSASP
jgi:hypothetical protein